MADEIKSTLEIALEKAEKIGKASKEELELLQLKEEAQRLSGKFLRDDLPDFEEKIVEILKNKNPQQKKVIYQGIVDVFLKNIVLPHYEYQIDNNKKAIEGLKKIFKNVPEISKICQQLEILIKEYYRHKEALLKRFNTGVEALEKALSDQLGAEVKVNIEEHPQFKEEWNKIKEKLDEEYGKQLEYFKNLFRKIVS